MAITDFFGSIIGKTAERRQRRAASVGNASGEMPLLEHVYELRRQLVRCVWIFLGFALVSFAFMEPLVLFLRKPFDVYQQSVAKPQELMAIGVLEVMVMNFQICLMVAGVVATPFILWQIWQFIAPALYTHEKRMGRVLLFASILLFYSGISFGYFVIVPVFLEQTLSWASQYAMVVLTFQNYFTSLATMVVLFGIIFEVPILLSLLGLGGILKSSDVSKNRKIVFLLSFILGAILSPPDIISQALVSVPLYVMCELSVWVLKWIESQKQQVTN